jgi:putative hydrolase
MRWVSGTVFAMQVGQAIGGLAREVMGLTDIGLPLTGRRLTALVPGAIVRFTEGLDAPLEEVRLFLAVREAASARLFTHVHWLGPHLMAEVAAYARGIDIDVERIEEAMRELDPRDTEAVRAALASGAFQVRHTPAQQAVLTRLETMLALVEGWVDDVAGHAAGGRLPHATGLSEMVRRRRASGGPAERVFATLVGLELRPRRAREAAVLWRTIADQDSATARDALWTHPDLLPQGEDLDSPKQFAENRARKAADDAAVDAAIAELLDSDD